MNYGLYLAGSSVAVNLYRQDVFANNLANVQTTGFKRDLASVAQRDPEAVEDGFFDMRQDLLDRLGGGVLAGPQQLSLEQGRLDQTGRPLDLALESPNAFFNVGKTDPATGTMMPRLTRAGTFSLNDHGTLVNNAGLPVLDVNDNPITIQVGAEVTFGASGDVFQNGEAVAKLGISEVHDPAQLVKEGANLFTWHGRGDLRSRAQDFTLRQGYLESSNVDSIRALMEVIAATKAISSSGNMIRYHDLLMERAVNVLGRVVA